MRGWLFVALTLPLFIGCAGTRPPELPVTSQPTTDATTQASSTTLPTTEPIPPENIITSANFERLWKAAEDVARDRIFVIDREDYRNGVLTTEPMVSAQFFEPWRRDALKASAVAESSLATIRRTIRFTFTRNDDDTYSLVPHVLVERLSSAERRITKTMMYRSAFRRSTAVGSAERDRGIELPRQYWYRIGNDPVLERDLAKAVRKRI